jgi:hypothetical protein
MDTKKIVTIVIVVFLGFWMITEPGGLASTSESLLVEGWDLTTQLFSGLIDFIGSF